MKIWMRMLPLLALSACGKDAALDAPVEVVQESEVALRVSAAGEVRSAKATPLSVPGQGWSQRQLEWMVPEGSQVKQGELIARFMAGHPKECIDCPGYKIHRLSTGCIEKVLAAVIVEQVLPGLTKKP